MTNSLLQSGYVPSGVKPIQDHLRSRLGGRGPRRPCRHRRLTLAASVLKQGRGSAPSTVRLNLANALRTEANHAGSWRMTSSITRVNLTSSDEDHRRHADALAPSLLKLREPSKDGKGGMGGITLIAHTSHSSPGRCESHGGKDSCRGQRLVEFLCWGSKKTLLPLADVYARFGEHDRRTASGDERNCADLSNLYCRYAPADFSHAPGILRLYKQKSTMENYI